MTEGQPATDSSPVEQPNSTQVAKAENKQSSVSLAYWLVFALIAGGLTWIILQMTYPVFEVPSELINLGPFATAEQEMELFAARGKAERQNAILFVALLGALTGGGLGIALATRRQSWSALMIGSVVGSVVGILAGGLLGAAGGLLGDIACVALRTGVQPLSLEGTVLTQCVTLGMLGIGVGLGLGVFSGHYQAATNYLAAGIFAGVGAGVIYPVVVALVLPGAQTEWTLPPDGRNQAIWIVVTSVSLGVMMSLANQRRIR